MKQNKLILGTVQFGLNYGINNQKGLMSEDESYKILELASSNGINTLDTAPAYGLSEYRIGKYNAQNTQLKIITKFNKTGDVSWEESLKNSLIVLKTKKFRSIIFHSFGDYLENKSRIHSIIKYGANNLFDTLGVSVYTNEELEFLIDDSNIDLIQLPFNLLDNHSQRSRVIKELKKAGKEIHTRSVFLQGLFFRELNTLPNNLIPLRGRLIEIQNIAKTYNVHIGHLALQYSLSKNYIDGVLIGVDSLDQLKTNISWANENIPDTIFNLIDDIIVNDVELLNPSKW